MTSFEDGPAKGKHLMLKRAPRFLRVVEDATGVFDALDQPEDTPRTGRANEAKRLMAGMVRGATGEEYMSRSLLCSKCGVLKPMHSEDIAMGWNRRRTHIRVRKPDGHGIVVNGEFSGLASIYCDGCGKPIPDGEEVVAVTMWRDATDGGEPGMWERDYEAP